MMKKIISLVLCFILVFSLAGCGGNGGSGSYSAAYEEGYDAGYKEGMKANAGVKKAKFSGEFTASVEMLIPDYYARPGNTVAVVHFFQDRPFLLFFSEDMSGKLEEGKAYVFEFLTFDVDIPDSESHPDIKDYMEYIEVSGYRLASDDEKGLASKTADMEVYISK